VVFIKTDEVRLRSWGHAVSAMRRQAIAYARRGWPVLPLYEINPNGACACTQADCRSPGKHPRVRGGYKAATPAVTQIERWWSRWPDASIGIATGRRAGFVALDVDDRHGGGDALHELERLNGELPRSPESLTGGGGRHVLLAIPNNVTIPSSEGKIAAGLDVRGDGGLIVAPPSIHISGRAYTWDVSAHPDDVPIADMPDWLAARAVADTRRRRSAHLTPPGRKQRARDHAGRSIPVGKRNLTLFRRAGAMHRAGLSEAAIRAALHAENKLCTVPLTDNEIDGIAVKASNFLPPWMTDRVAFMSDPRLTSQERLVLHALVDHADAEGRCHPGYRRIEQATGIGRTTVGKRLARLEDLKRVIVESRSQKGNRYVVLPFSPIALPATSHGVSSVHTERTRSERADRTEVKAA
jgi:hypothetical protein